MASQFDLAPRLAALQAAGLKVSSTYYSTPARWLVSAVENFDAFAINCKGVPVSNTPVVITLAKLEELIQRAGTLATVESEQPHPQDEPTTTAVGKRRARRERRRQRIEEARRALGAVQPPPLTEAETA